MTTREIQGHLKELYQVEISPTLISAVTDAVLEDVRAWQARPLDAVYPIVYLDSGPCEAAHGRPRPEPGGVPGTGH
jgi:transposase-like protein